MCLNGIYPGWDIKTEKTIMKSTNTPGWVFDYSEWNETNELYSKTTLSRFRFPDDFQEYFRILFR